MMLFLVGVACQFQACPGPKPAPEPLISPTPAPTAPPPSAVPVAPDPPVARYSGVQQAEYIKTAQNGFVVARGLKSEAFALAFTAFGEAGGASAKGLASKADVADRRALIEKCRLANEDYLAFVGTQDDTYRQELAKTPLIPGDVDSLVDDFSKKAHADSLKKVRENKRDILKAADDMMAYLDKTFGAWKVNGNNAVFTKPADANSYSALAKKYNAFVQAEQKLQADINVPLPPPGDSPIPSVAPSPSASAVPATAMPTP